MSADSEKKEPKKDEKKPLPWKGRFEDFKFDQLEEVTGSERSSLDSRDDGGDED